MESTLDSSYIHISQLQHSRGGDCNLVSAGSTLIHLKSQLKPAGGRCKIYLLLMSIPNYEQLQN